MRHVTQHAPTKTVTCHMIFLSFQSLTYFNVTKDIILFEIFEMALYRRGIRVQQQNLSKWVLENAKNRSFSSREANSFALGKLLAPQYGEFEQTSVHILRQNKVISFLGTGLMKVSVCTTSLRGQVFLDDCAATSLQGQTPLLTSF